MASDQELNIVLKLIDKASAGIKKTLNETTKETEKLQKATEEVNKKTQNEFKKSTKGIREFRSAVTLLVAVLFTIVNATREYAKYNDVARKSVDEFDISLRKLGVNLGKIVLPLLNVLTQALSGYAMLANIVGNVVVGKGLVLDIDTDSINDAMRAEIALRNIADTQKKLNELFLVGKMEASDYYAKTIEGSAITLQLNQQKISSLQQLAQITKEVNDQAYMDDLRRAQEQTDLLMAYKDTYMKAHEGIAAFTATIARSIQTNLSGALSSIISGAMDARDAFKQLGQAMIKTISDFIAQKVVAFILEKTLLAGFVAASIKAGAAVAAAWGPAAVAVNIASFGAAGAAAAVSAAAAGISTATAMVTAGESGFAGSIGGYGGDASKGVNVSVGSAFGESSFAVGTPRVPQDMSARIHKNEMIIPEDFAEGIRSGELTLGNGGRDIAINIYYPKMTSQEEGKQIAQTLGLELERQLRYAG